MDIIIVLMLLAFKSQIALVCAIILVLGMFQIIILLWNYFRKKKFYTNLLIHLNQLEPKYLIAEMLEPSGFYEGKIMEQTLYEITKSMNEKISEYEKNLLDFKEFIELWIHEVKIPLSGLVLMIHNHKELDISLLEQVNRLENYVEQVLYYVRSENATKDYLITECSLEKIVLQVALKNKNHLLYHHVDLQTKNLDVRVLTDSKWLIFIINQIVNNSLKYRDLKKQSFIQIVAKKEKEDVIISIYDNGIGIPSHELPKVFEKSFTGNNGRICSTSTGMGLYICQQLCKKLGHKITVTSKEGEYTQVDIMIHKNSFYEVI